MFSYMTKTVFVVLALVTGSGILKASTAPRGFIALGTRLHPAAGKIAIPPGFTAAKPKSQQRMPKITEEQKKQGYLVFTKHYMDKIYPYTVPKAYELCTVLKGFASPGEYEPMTFAVRSLKELDGFNVAVSDLKSKDGISIPKHNIDVRLVENIPFKDLKQQNVYHMEPEILRKSANETLKKNRTYWFWVTFYIPPQQTAGTYRGKVTLSSQDSPSKQLDLLVKVFPVTLKDPPTERYMHIGGHEKNIKLRERYYTHMKEHGMTTVAPCNFSVYPYYKNGKIKLDFRRLDNEVALYKKVGFSYPLTIDMRPIQAWLITLQKEIDKYKIAGKPLPDAIPVKVKSFDISPTGRSFEEAEYKKIVKQIIQHAKANNYPELYYLPQEEATNKGTRVQQLKRFSKLLKECGVTVAGWSNGPWSGIDDLQDNDKNIDIRYYNYITPEIIERTRKSGDFFGIYNHGDRLMYGFFGRTVNAKGMGQWAYTFGGTKGIFSSGRMIYYDRMNYPGVDGPLASPAWEYIREGIDDAKYIYTLECLIQSQLQSKDPTIVTQAQKAQQNLNSILNQVPASTKALNHSEITPETLDIWRYKIIRMILDLEKNKPAIPKSLNQVKTPPGLILSIHHQKQETADIKGSSSQTVKLVAPYVTTPPQIDGALDDNIWKHAAVTRPFVLLHKQAQTRARAVAAENIGTVGKVEAGQKTVARLCYDNDNLYMAFNCSESQMNKLVTVCQKHDGAVWSDDSIELFLVPGAEMKSYYQMALNANGIRCDIKWHVINGKRVKGPAWNPNWTVKTKKRADCWLVELKIPFHAFGYKKAPEPGSCWQINLAREEQPSGGEYSSWPHLNRSFHELHNYGSLYFSKIPAVNIANIDTGNVCYGKNRLNVTLKRKTKQAYNLCLVLEITHDGKMNTFQKNMILDENVMMEGLNYTISNYGPIDMKLKVIDNKNKKLITQSIMKNVIPPVLSFKGLQKDIYLGDKVNRFELIINQSNDELKNTQGTLSLYKDGKMLECTQILNLKQGKTMIAINTATLATGQYKLQFSLSNAKGKSIAEGHDTFNVIETPF